MISGMIISENYEKLLKRVDFRVFARGGNTYLTSKHRLVGIQNVPLNEISSLMYVLTRVRMVIRKLLIFENARKIDETRKLQDPLTWGLRIKFSNLSTIFLICISESTI